MAQENDPSVASTRTRLPATASYTPSVGLAGLAALLTAVALRARRRATF
jgi:hypothetical protein